jgi:lactoylglutathione lyase
MAISGFFHGGITVSDIDRSLTFYRDGLGLEIEFDRILDAAYLREVLALGFDDMRAVYLRIPGGGFVELLEYRGVERLSAASRPCDYGAGHLCFYVEGIDDVFERLVSLGFRSRSNVVDITSGPNAGARSVYFADADGYLVELFQRRPAA